MGAKQCREEKNDSSSKKLASRGKADSVSSLMDDGTVKLVGYTSTEKASVEDKNATNGRISTKEDVEDKIVTNGVGITETNNLEDKKENMEIKNVETATKPAGTDLGKDCNSLELVSQMDLARKISVTPRESENWQARHGEDSISGLAAAGAEIIESVSDVFPQTSNRNGNITIVCHSDSTTISQSSKSEMLHSGSDNLAGQMNVIANWYKRKDHLYVETRAYRELKTILDETFWATLIGRPGDGKSSTAAHLMLHYRNKGYEPVFLGSLQDWKTLIATDDTADKSIKQLVVIDDMFGTSCVEQGKVWDWLSWLESMQKIVEERKGNLLVVCTSRRYIFADVQSSVARFQVFRKSTVVDMTEEFYKLSGDEKVEIFDKFSYEYKITDFNSQEARNLDPPHGFPFCVEMFCRNLFLRQNGFAFFDNPVECVQKEIMNFKDNDIWKYVVLIVALLKKNRMPGLYFDNLIETATDDEKKLLKSSGVSFETDTPKLLKAKDALINTYLKFDPDGFYCFIHESLMENLADVFISTDPCRALEMVDFKYIKKFIKPSSEKGHDSRKGAVVTVGHSLDSINKVLCKRICEEIKMGNVLEICRCEIWSDDFFVDDWTSYVESEEMNHELPMLLSKSDTSGTGWDVHYKLFPI